MKNDTNKTAYKRDSYEVMEANKFSSKMCISNKDKKITQRINLAKKTWEVEKYCEYGANFSGAK
jgi:hypothetical protein